MISDGCLTVDSLAADMKSNAHNEMTKQKRRSFISRLKQSFVDRCADFDYISRGYNQVYMFNPLESAKVIIVPRRII